MPGNRKAAEQEPGIYVVSDQSVAMAYVGSTVDGPARFRNHLSDLRNNRHHNPGLQNAFNQGHQLQVLFIPVEQDVDVKECEQHLLDEFAGLGILYNTSTNALSGMAGRQHAAESIEKMRTAKLGKTLSQEHREKIAVALIGRVHSPESIERMRESGVGKGLGRKLPQETIEKVRLASTGRLHTDEAKAKMSAAATGRRQSPEHAEKSRATLAACVESKSISVTISGIEYPSVLAASKATGIPRSTLAARVARNGKTL